VLREAKGLDPKQSLTDPYRLVVGLLFYRRERSDLEAIMGCCDSLA
jgi:hypothetical protein